MVAPVYADDAIEWAERHHRAHVERATSLPVLASSASNWLRIAYEYLCQGAALDVDAWVGCTRRLITPDEFGDVLAMETARGIPPCSRMTIGELEALANYPIEDDDH
jgi:hypothetical protein